MLIREGVKSCLRWIMISVLLVLSALVGANWFLLAVTEADIQTELKQVEGRSVAVVFGTARYLRGGGLNPHYTGRIDAAVDLYHSGKVGHLLVSGDNAHPSYNEPRRMFQDLVRAGVPAEAITLDFAGFSTFDTLVRAQRVFGVDDAILVTQRWHLPRALFIARFLGLNSTGYTATDPGLRSSLKVRSREALARLATLGDLYLWQREPRFLGGQEPIKRPERTVQTQAY